MGGENELVIVGRKGVENDLGVVGPEFVVKRKDGGVHVQLVDG